MRSQESPSASLPCRHAVSVLFRLGGECLPLGTLRRGGLCRRLPGGSANGGTSGCGGFPGREDRRGAEEEGRTISGRDVMGLDAGIECVRSYWIKYVMYYGHAVALILHVDVLRTVRWRSWRRWNGITGSRQKKEADQIEVEETAQKEVEGSSTCEAHHKATKHHSRKKSC
jgi:hypothetical protein